MKNKEREVFSERLNSVLKERNIYIPIQEGDFIMECNNTKEPIKVGTNT